MTEFSIKVKEARKGAGLTQQGMADLMLIPRRTIQDWERGLFDPPAYVQRFVLNELEAIGEQRRACKEVAEQNWFVVINENPDDEMGDQTECPQFQKMMQRVERGDFESVICSPSLLEETDADIREHLEAIKASGVSVQGYIQGLIRSDIARVDDVVATFETANENDAENA